MEKKVISCMLPFHAEKAARFDSNRSQTKMTCATSNAGSR